MLNIYDQVVDFNGMVSEQTIVHDSNKYITSQEGAGSKIVKDRVWYLQRDFERGHSISTKIVVSELFVGCNIVDNEKYWRPS